MRTIVCLFTLALVGAACTRSAPSPETSGPWLSRKAADEMLETNMSHAWGAAPLVLFPKQILGIQQTQPGWRAIRFRPNLHSLKWAQGTIPTPHGNISVWLKRGADSQLTGRIRLPKSIQLETDTNEIKIERYEK